MSFTDRDSFGDHIQADVAFCRLTPSNFIMETRDTRELNFPFPLNWDDSLFSFVTCSGREDVGFSLKILFSPFQPETWVCMLSCAGLIIIT